MDIVTDLQIDLTNSSKRLSEILPKAYLVAKKLQLTDFADWINNEMSGYRCRNDCPSYRNIKGMLKGRNPYVNWQVIPVFERDVEKKLEQHIQTSSIAELEEIAEKGDSVYNPLPSEIIGYMKLENCTQLGIFCPPKAFKSIIEAVRKMLLDWTLELESEGIKKANMSFLDTEIKKAKEATSTTFITNINGGNNMLAQGSKKIIQNQDNKKSDGVFATIWTWIKKIFLWWKK